jgi:AraC-like DNA-binding protein
MDDSLDNLKIPPQLAGLIVEVLKEQGVASAQVLRGSGIRPVLLERDDTYFSYKQMLALIENALALTTTPDDTPLQYSDPITARISLKLVEQMLERHSSEADFVLEVRRILLRSPGQFPDMESVADELGMSSRSLRRKLGELDTSFKGVLDDVRRRLAIDYLQNSKLTLEEITALLGYTESTNFRRAFKLWTGHPPSHYRCA